jgi:hypothetical protein
MATSDIILKQPGQFAENDGENDHGQERAYDGPSRSDHCLFLAHGNVPPRQYLKQFTVAPSPGTTEFNNQPVLVRNVDCTAVVGMADRRASSGKARLGKRHDLPVATWQAHRLAHG